jgi:hypothetical protein
MQLGGNGYQSRAEPNVANRLRKFEALRGRTAELIGAICQRLPPPIWRTVKPHPLASDTSNGAD